jgi:hypothetical protein
MKLQMKIDFGTNLETQELWREIFGWPMMSWGPPADARSKHWKKEVGLGRLDVTTGLWARLTRTGG